MGPMGCEIRDGMAVATGGFIKPSVDKDKDEKAEHDKNKGETQNDEARRDKFKTAREYNDSSYQILAMEEAYIRRQQEELSQALDIPISVRVNGNVLRTCEFEQNGYCG